MAGFLADENVPVEAVEAVRRLGLDLTWINEFAPGAGDDSVLALAH